MTNADPSPAPKEPSLSEQQQLSLWLVAGGIGVLVWGLIGTVPISESHFRLVVSPELAKSTDWQTTRLLAAGGAAAATFGFLLWFRRK